MQYHNYNQQENQDKNAVNRHVWRKMYKEFEKYKPIGLEAERRLIAAIQANADQLDKVQEELNQLVLANSRFVVNVAKRYATPSIPLEDLVQEGFIGLRLAAVKFVPQDNNKLITFAVYHIRRAMISFIEKTIGQVRCPIKHVKESPINASECDGDLELAYAIDGNSPNESPPVYVDAMETELMFMPDLDTQELHEQNDIKDAIWSYVGRLCDIEQKAIRLHYGLDGGPALKKNAVAKELKINKLYLNTVLESAMKNLKAMALCDF